MGTRVESASAVPPVPVVTGPVAERAGKHGLVALPASDYARAHGAAGDSVVQPGSGGGRSVFLVPADEPFVEYSDAAAAAEAEQAGYDSLQLPEAAPPPPETPEAKEAFAKVDQVKAKGNAAFKQGAHSAAVKAWEEALQLLLGKHVAATPKAQDVAIALQNNLAAAYIKLEQYKNAILQCDRTVVMDRNNVKALFRRAEAHRALKQYSKALVDLEKARSLEPRNRDVVCALEEVEDLLDFEGDGPLEDEGEEAEAAGPGSQHADDGEGAELDPSGIPQDQIDFATKMMDMYAREFVDSGELPSVIYMRHMNIDGQDEGTGKVIIEDAFTSSETLEDSMTFVRGQHFTASARSSVVFVPKSKVLYPLVWWAGTWPFEIEQDGVFAELATRKATKVWFMPLEDGATNLMRGVPLEQDCSLLAEVETMFPPGPEP